MALFRRKSVWWMRFTYQGKQIRRTTGTENKKLAERIYHKVLGEIAEGKWFQRLPGEEKTFREMMERYMVEHSEVKKASPVRDQSSLTHLLAVFSDCPIADISPMMINDYKNQRRREKASPSTINRELSLMKHAYSLTIREWGWIENNPVKKISMEKEPPARDRWLTHEEEKMLLSVALPWLNPVIVFAVETGCRRGEMLSLCWKSVDLYRKVITIHATKTGDRRSVPLTQKALKILEGRRQMRKTVCSLKQDLLFTHPEGRKINFHTLRWAFEEAVKRAGIEHIRWHDLRHTFASRLAQSGVDPYTIQRLMGHKNFATTQRYAHHHIESLRRGIESLEAFAQERLKKLAQN